MRLTALTGLVFVLALAACEPRQDECSHGEERCRGNSRLLCIECDDFDWGCSNTWFSTSCGDEFCIEGAGHAFCAVSAEPDPRCESKRSFCEGDAIMGCEQGYLVGLRESCDRGGKTCAQQASGATLCALSSEPDARCLDGSPFVHVCGGASLLECGSGGFLLDEQVCEFGCISPGDGLAYCPLSAADNARCAAEAEGLWFCEGASHYVCRDGVALELQDCAAQRQKCAIDTLGRAQCTSSWILGDDDAGAP